MMHIAIVESDPLRSIGFRALLESESDFDLIAAALPEMLMRQDGEACETKNPWVSETSWNGTCRAAYRPSDRKSSRRPANLHLVIALHSPNALRETGLRMCPPEKAGDRLLDNVTSCWLKTTGAIQCPLSNNFRFALQPGTIAIASRKP